MGEQFNIGKVEKNAEAAKASSLADSFLTKEQISKLTAGADSALIKRAIEASEQFSKALQEAVDLMHPIVTRINNLPEEHKQELLASVSKSKGPGYDLVRQHCA